MTSVSVMMTVFVLNLHYRGPKKNELPFWLQQLLSLSLANTVRAIGRSKKVRIQANNSTSAKEHRLRKRPSPDVSAKTRPSAARAPSNGILSTYTNINETQIKTRLTTEVSH